MTPPPETSLPARKHVLLAACLLFCLAFWVYLPAGDNDFVDFDDGAYVTQNPVVQGGLSAEGLRWAFLETHSSNWHPLTWLSHMLDVQLFGLQPRGHHLMAVGLHALCAALAFLALLVLTRSFWPSLLVALFFALHPQRVESVAWVSERKDVLSGVFFFLSLWAYGHYARSSERRYYIVLCLALGLGLLAKQMLVTLPCLLLVLDGWPLGRFKSLGIKRCLVEKLPLFGLVLAAGLMTLYAQDKGGAISSLENLPMDVRLAGSLWASVAYMGQMLWPVDLAFFYPHPYLVKGSGYALWNARELGSAALLIGLSALALWQRRARPWCLSGWLWYLGLLAPVVGIVHVGTQSMADRYTYLTTIGLYIAIVWSVAGWLRSPALQKGFVAAGIVLALAMIPRTRAQIATWKDSPTLFQHAIGVTEHNYIAHSNYGFYLQRNGQPEAAELQYQKALEYAPYLVDAHSNLGAIYIDRQEYERARGKLQEALRINSGFQDALMLMGLLEENLGQLSAAGELYGRVLKQHPNYGPGLSAKARVTRELGQPAESLQLLQEAQQRGLDAPEIWLELGQAQWALGAASEAQSSFDRGLRRHPNHGLLRLACALFYGTTRDPKLRNGNTALQLLAPLQAAQDWRTLQARSAALAAGGDFERARPMILDAMVKAPKRLRPELQKTYEAYKARRLVTR